MAGVFTGATGKDAAAEAGFHAEIVSDGHQAVLSILDLATQVWRMALIEDAKELASNTACAAYAIRAAATPNEQGAVSEDENEALFDRCLDAEEKIKASAADGDEVDVDDEEDDEDNDYL